MCKKTAIAAIPLATPEDRKALFRPAVDGNRIAPVLQRHLRPLAAVPVRVAECKARVESSRSLRQSGNLTVKYDVVVAAEDGRRWRHLVLGTLPVARRFAEVDPPPPAAGTPGIASAGPFEHLAAFVPELEMGLQVHPFDRNLPVLLDVMRGDCGRLLAPFFPESRNGAVIERVEHQLADYKPANRCVLRLKVTLSPADGRRIERVVFAKIYSDDRIAERYDDIRALWRMSDRFDHLRIPEPLGYDPVHRILVMNEAAGRSEPATWIARLEKGGPLPPGADGGRLNRFIKTAARVLGELHTSGIRPKHRRTYRTELARLREDHDFLRRAQPELSRDVGRLLDRLDAVSLDDEPLATCHGGFRPNQLVGGEDAVTVLDWDDLCLANPASDAATFLRALRLRRIARAGASAELDRLAALFAREFLARRQDVSPRDLARYEALGFLDEALRSFYRPPRGGRTVEKIRALLAAAGRFALTACKARR